LRGPHDHGPPVDDPPRDAPDARARVRALRAHQGDHGGPRRRATAGVRLRAALVLVMGAVLAAGASSANTPRATSSATGSATATFDQPTLTPVSVTQSTYGRVVASTTPGAPCRVEVHVGPPQFGDVPPASVDATADASGSLAVSYAAPTLPKQTARYVVTCGAGPTVGSAAADFPIAGYPIPATHFTARINVAGVNDQIAGVTARPDPSLSAVRDRDVDLLPRPLVSERAAAPR